MSFDIFISHHHDDLNLVAGLANEFEKRGYTCWYAPRNVRGKYGKAIFDGISQSKIFLLILNSRSAVSQAVLDEVETAHNIMKGGKMAIIQPLCIEKIDVDNASYGEMMYYIRRLQFITFTNDLCIEKAVDSVLEYQSDVLVSPQKRTASSYFSQSVEDERLSLQNQIFDLFDESIFIKKALQYNTPRILDVGCGDGKMIIQRISHFSEYSLLGVDRSERQISIANAGFCSDHNHFSIMNIDASDFESNLLNEMVSLGIEYFDIINISMVLLHVKKAERLLQTLYKVLDSNGILLIRDIDDGLNFAYPDTDNSFDRIYRMCDRDEESGVRKSGRQIFTFLSHAGYSRICLERQGLSTIGMNDKQKKALFDIYFPFILANAEKMCHKYPYDSEIQDDYLWYQKNYPKIRKKFLNSDFVFNLGLLFYSCQK